jgi:hypothetical protein
MEHMNMVKVFVGNSGGCRKYLEKWLEDVENYLRYMGVKRWRLKASVRQEWSVIVGEMTSYTELNVTVRVAVRRWTVARMTVEFITLENVCVCVCVRISVVACMAKLSLIATVRNIVTGFPHRCVKIREVTREILRRKCCISVCPITNLYIAEILVMNVYGRNRKLYSTFASHTVQMKRTLRVQ